jgi:hypothetical protein
MTVLKVAFYEVYPMANGKCKIPTWHANTRCHLPGLAIEMIKLIADYLNWTVEVFPIKYPDDFNYEVLENGTVDLQGITIEKTDVRSEYFDFSDELYEVSFG